MGNGDVTAVSSLCMVGSERLTGFRRRWATNLTASIAGRQENPKSIVVVVDGRDEERASHTCVNMSIELLSAWRMISQPDAGQEQPTTGADRIRSCKSKRMQQTYNYRVYNRANQDPFLHHNARPTDQATYTCSRQQATWSMPTPHERERQDKSNGRTQRSLQFSTATGSYHRSLPRAPYPLSLAPYPLSCPPPPPPP